MHLNLQGRSQYSDVKFVFFNIKRRSGVKLNCRAPTPTLIIFKNLMASTQTWHNYDTTVTSSECHLYNISSISEVCEGLCQPLAALVFHLFRPLTIILCIRAQICLPPESPTISAQSISRNMPARCSLLKSLPIRLFLRWLKVWSLISLSHLLALTDPLLPQVWRLSKA